MKSILPLLAFTLFSMASRAAEPAAALIPPPSGDWEFRLQPYAWLTGIDGTTGFVGFPAEIDSGFEDVFDVLEIAAAFQFEARRDHWGFIADAFYAELGTSGTLPAPTQATVDVDFKQFIGEFVMFYRVNPSPQSFMDLYAGLRYNSIDLEISGVPSASGGRSNDKSWADPLIGIRSQWEIDGHWYIAALGDIGGFGVESDLTWNLQGSVGYRFKETFSLEVGYRYFDTDYSDDAFIYDIVQSGALMELNFTF